MLSALLDRALNSGAVSFDWHPTLSAERHSELSLDILWDLLQEMWSRTRTARYDMDALRAYPGPASLLTGVSPAAGRRSFVLQSISGDERCARILRAADVSPAGWLRNGSRFSGTDRRILWNALIQGRRAIDPRCGWYNIHCDGVFWYSRPLAAAAQKAQLDVERQVGMLVHKRRIAPEPPSTTRERKLSL